MSLISQNKVKIEGGMSSMTDLVFLLLIFFIILSALAKNAVDVDLPEGGTTAEPKAAMASVVVQKDNTILMNASVFANINKHAVVGLELNNTDPTLQKIDDNEMTLLILPQAHYEFDSGWAFQVGFGPNIKKDDTYVSGVLRVIKSF